MIAIYAFSIMSHFCLDEWMLVVAELDADVEVRGGTWSSPALL
jgi:hypothetical protein